MEKISESTPKGRPKLLTGALRRAAEFAANPGVTERTKQNKFYQLRAILALGLKVEEDTPEAYRWIWPPGNPQTGEHRVRWTILGELGRIYDDDLMRENAAYICQQQMKTPDALAVLRRARVGKVKDADETELANVIIEAVNGYLHRRQPVERESFKRALALVGAQFGCDTV